MLYGKTWKSIKEKRIVKEKMVIEDALREKRSFLWKSVSWFLREKFLLSPRWYRRSPQKKLFRVFCANPRRSAGEKKFSVKIPLVDLCERNFIESRWYRRSPQKNLFRDFCANPRRSAGEKSFSGKISADLPESFYYLEWL